MIDDNTKAQIIEMVARYKAIEAQICKAHEEAQSRGYVTLSLIEVVPLTDERERLKRHFAIHFIPVWEAWLALEQQTFIRVGATKVRPEFPIMPDENEWDDEEQDS